MSDLISDLRRIFGDNFGEELPKVQNLDEEVRISLQKGELTEADHPMPINFRRDKGVLPGKGHDRPSESKRSSKTHSGDLEMAKKISNFVKDYKNKKPADPNKSGAKTDYAALKGHAQHGGAQLSKASELGGKGMHNPFKRRSKLGVGPGTPPGYHGSHGARKHNEKRCWKCNCGDIYSKSSGCHCVGTGKDETCPKGHTKKVVIKYKYRQAYNDMYHAWRRGKHGETTKS
jgi:hypothetical protein